MGSTTSPGRVVGYIAGAIVLLVFAVLGIGACNSFKSVDPGHVAIVKEGGPFDGRALKSVREPGSKISTIGMWNKQYELPTTQRDLTEESGRIVVPTADGVNVVVDGQALFQLRVDGEPDMNKNVDAVFFRNFGLRTWDGEHIWDDDGWVNFLKIRLVPILYQSIRQTIGRYECTQLNNTCIYVLNANAILADTGDKAKAQDKASEQAKQVNVSQNLAEAEAAITEAFQSNLKAGLGNEYFEHIRFQNLRVTFEPDIQRAVTSAQGKRAEVAKARLEAQRVTAAAQGRADAAVAAARGDRDAKIAAASGARALARAYKLNPALARIEQIKALCGVDGDGNPKGCENLQVLGGGGIINQLK